MSLSLDGSLGSKSLGSKSTHGTLKSRHSGQSVFSTASTVRSVKSSLFGVDCTRTIFADPRNFGEKKAREAVLQAQQGKLMEAFKAYCQAAEYGHSGANFELGVMYHRGVPSLGLAADLSEAARRYLLAGIGGLPSARYNLSFLYAAGLGGLKKSTDRSLALLDSAAEMGHASASRCLAEKLFAGVTRDRALGALPEDVTSQEAIFYWALAAKNGNAQACVALTVVFSEGAVVRVDGALSDKLNDLAILLWWNDQEPEAVLHGPRTDRILRLPPYFNKAGAAALVKERELVKKWQKGPRTIEDLLEKHRPPREKRDKQKKPAATADAEQADKGGGSVAVAAAEGGGQWGEDRGAAKPKKNGPLSGPAAGKALLQFLKAMAEKEVAAAESLQQGSKAGSDEEDDQMTAATRAQRNANANPCAFTFRDPDLGLALFSDYQKLKARAPAAKPRPPPPPRRLLLSGRAAATSSQTQSMVSSQGDCATTPQDAPPRSLALNRDPASSSSPASSSGGGGGGKSPSSRRAEKESPSARDGVNAKKKGQGQASSAGGYRVNAEPLSPASGGSLESVRADQGLGSLVEESEESPAAPHARKRGAQSMSFREGRSGSADRAGGTLREEPLWSGSSSGSFREGRSGSFRGEPWASGGSSVSFREGRGSSIDRASRFPDITPVSYRRE